MALRKQAFSGKNSQLLYEWYIALYYVTLQDIFLDFWGNELYLNFVKISVERCSLV